MARSRRREFGRDKINKQEFTVRIVTDKLCAIMHDTYKSDVIDETISDH